MAVLKPRLTSVSSTRDEERSLRAGGLPYNRPSMASIGHIAVGMAAARFLATRRTPRWSSMAMVVRVVVAARYRCHRLYAWRRIRRSVGPSRGDALADISQSPSARRRPLAPGFVCRGRPARTSRPSCSPATGCSTRSPMAVSAARSSGRSISRVLRALASDSGLPIGLDFLSLSGLGVALIEVVLFAPLILFGVRFDRLYRYVLRSGLYRSG